MYNKLYRLFHRIILILFNNLLKDIKSVILLIFLVPNFIICYINIKHIFEKINDISTLGKAF